MKRIVCAANKMPDGTVIIGIRHFCKLMHQNILAHYGEDPPSEIYHNSIQGFVDQFGDFHNRKEAYRIALESGQVSFRQGFDWEDFELYSEDLY